MGKKRYIYIYIYLESWAFLGIEFSNLISYLLGEEPILPLLFVPQHTGFPLPYACNILHILSIFYFWNSPQPWIVSPLTHFLSSYKQINPVNYIFVFYFINTYVQWFSFSENISKINWPNSSIVMPILSWNIYYVSCIKHIKLFISNKLWNISTIKLIYDLILRLSTLVLKNNEELYSTKRSNVFYILFLAKRRLLSFRIWIG